MAAGYSRAPASRSWRSSGRAGATARRRPRARRPRIDAAGGALGVVGGLTGLRVRARVLGGVAERRLVLADAGRGAVGGLRRALAHRVEHDERHEGRDEQEHHDRCDHIAHARFGYPAAARAETVCGRRAGGRPSRDGPPRRNHRRRRNPRRHELPARAGVVPCVPPARDHAPAVGDPPPHRHGRRPARGEHGGEGFDERARRRRARRRAGALPLADARGAAAPRRPRPARAAPCPRARDRPGLLRQARRAAALPGAPRRPLGRRWLDRLRRRRADQARAGPRRGRGREGRRRRRGR